MKKVSVKGAKFLKTIHLIFISIWFGGVMSWFPVIHSIDIKDLEITYGAYLNMRSIAWNVIGWGGIGSFITGLLNGWLTKWGIFRHKWIAFKFFSVICLILFGMFFLESRLLENIEMLVLNGEAALQSEAFLRNHALIKAGLIFEALAFVTIISVSIFKPWGKLKKGTDPESNAVLK